MEIRIYMICLLLFLDMNGGFRCLFRVASGQTHLNSVLPAEVAELPFGTTRPVRSEVAMRELSPEDVPATRFPVTATMNWLAKPAEMKRSSNLYP